ncbi:MAG: hypothetical protein KDH96_01750 [Candidatus Riesia sp.]|nr:hypothetical protein [Candidatus Riesia sp.]
MSKTVNNVVIVTDFPQGKVFENWSKVDPNFLDLITRFFKDIGITKASLNLAYEYREKKSYHKFGQAFDILYLVWKGRTYNFSRRLPYSVSNDDEFYNEFTSYFCNYSRFEYISPARIHTGSTNTYNIYRNYSQSQAVKVLDDMRDKGLGYEINRSHLHHLHLALDPNSKKKTLPAVEVVQEPIQTIPETQKSSPSVGFWSGLWQRLEAIITIKGKK